MGRHLTQEEIDILKHEFDQYDQDNGGNITVEEFGKVMKATGQQPSDEEIAQIIKEVDIDGDGTINFNEFISMMTGQTKSTQQTAPAASAANDLEIKQIQEVDSDAELKAAWKAHDPTFKGSLTTAQFRQVMADLGESVSDVEVDEILNSVDGGGDRITFAQFMEFVKRKEVNEIVDGY